MSLSPFWGLCLGSAGAHKVGVSLERLWWLCDPHCLVSTSLQRREGAGEAPLVTRGLE